MNVSAHSPIARLALWGFAMLALLAGVLAWENAVTAQDDNAEVNAAPADDGATADAGEPADPADASGPSSLGMMIVDSGWFGWIFYIALAIFSMVGLMVSLERLINLRKGKIAPAGFLRRVIELGGRSEGTAVQLRELADSSATPAGRVLKAGAMRAGRSVIEVEKAMEDAALRETAELRSRNRPLSVIGNIAPLVGLLGTVVGMIFAFQTAEAEGLGQNAAGLAAGIKLALITTAAGLTIAVPAMLLTAWFNNRVDKFMRQIAAAIGETIPLFTRLEQSPTENRNQTDSNEHREELAESAS